ncbi:MAG TPA: glycosyltransferase, partial [Flavisolibacter sp.]|nr:glycosyltransferase [Flavisolibacter sp.]
IPVYNCAAYLSDTLQSVLVQDMGEALMQIEVVDDCSTDADVQALVQQIGGGRVLYYRQRENVGSLRNFETCLNRAQGVYVHLLHGDDRVRPGFYQKISSLFERFPAAGAAFCRYSFIDSNGELIKERFREANEDGLLQNWLLRIAERQAIQFAAMVVRREVYEKVGSFYGMTHGEDWEMWVRIAKYYPVAYTPELLADYRTHDRSLTWFDLVNGNISTYIDRAINAIQEHVPEKNRKAILLSVKRYYARTHIAFDQQIWQKEKNRQLTIKHLEAALNLHKSMRIYFHVLKLYSKMGIERMASHEPFPQSELKH